MYQLNLQIKIGGLKKRSEVWNNAVNSKNTWGKIKETDMKKDYLGDNRDVRI